MLKLNKSKKGKVLPSDFSECIDDLLKDENVQSMKNFKQHCGTNCLQHCINVSYYTYKICRKLNYDYKSAARGALLHDLFLYDWRTTKLDRGKHAFRHPDIALANARQNFTLNKIEEDTIQKHMWPLTIKPPRYKEAFIVSMVDKFCASEEILRYFFKS